jgi:hypothetical protein
VLRRHGHRSTSPAPTRPVVSGNLAALAPFGSGQTGILAPVTLLSPVRVAVCVDIGGRVAELDESNNCHGAILDVAE